MARHAVRGFDHVLKVVVMGESGVGKSCLVSVFADEVYVEDRAPTVAVDIRTVSMSVGEKRIKCLVWDTAGQERFRSLGGSYYRGAQLAILCFDITNYDSFAKLQGWAQELEHNLGTPDGVVTVLVGTKADRQANRVVSEAEAEAFAAEKGCLCYCETSAITGKGVKELFRCGVHEVTRRPSLLQTSPSVVTVTVPNPSSFESLCC